MNTNEAKKIVTDAVKTKQATDRFVDHDELRTALKTLKHVTWRPVSKELFRAIGKSGIFANYTPTPGATKGRVPLTPEMSWSAFACILDGFIPYIQHKMMNGIETVPLTPVLAKGHGTQSRAKMYLSLEDRSKVLRGTTQWEAVITDQVTGVAYHVEGKSCGLTDDDDQPICNCDALAWPLTKSEVKAYLKQAQADRIAFIERMKQARVVVGKEIGEYHADAFYIVDKDGDEDIFAGEECYATKTDAEKVLAETLEAEEAELAKATVVGSRSA